MKKLFLTSAITLCTICPAMAETFPVDGNMLENKTYDEAATYTNMGVYEGSVSANAYYDDIVYNIAAGNYLAAGSEATNGTQCPAGSWCPGISNINYSANTNQGLNACPQDYSNSVAGASANTQCYRTCSTDDVAHSATVSGQMYYDGTSGDGVNACEPATCVSGYHKKDVVNNPDLISVIGTSEAGNGYTSNTNSGSERYSSNMSNTIISGDALAFAVDYGNKGVIKGHGRCSSASPITPEGDYDENQKAVSQLANQTGQEGASNCYCQLDSYTASGSQTSVTLSGPWVFNTLDVFANANTCAAGCAYNCAYSLNTTFENSVLRIAIFNEYQSSPAMCEANTITINWSDASAEDIAANNAGTATYGSDIRTPYRAQTKPGQVFRGWRFSKPVSNNNNNQQ